MAVGKIANFTARLRERIRSISFQGKFDELREQFRERLAKERLERDTGSIDQVHEDTLKDFSRVIDFTMRVSMSAAGDRTNDAGAWASIVFIRMCINACSVETLANSTIFDHASIAIICRTIMESMTIYYYLQESVDANEWHCRELVLKLHDTTSRIKLMRAHQSKEQYQDLIKGRASLTEELRANSYFKALKSEQQKRLLTGEQIFVGGMNAAARAGWDQEIFMSFYNYFSAQSHSAPMSFMRFSQHNIDYFAPSGPQKSLVDVAICVATACLIRVSIRHLSTSRAAESKVGRLEVALFKRRSKQADRLLKGEAL
jgi:Family of unknown function (DUF5677)